MFSLISPSLYFITNLKCVHARILRAHTYRHPRNSDDDLPAIAVAHRGAHKHALCVYALHHFLNHLSMQNHEYTCTHAVEIPANGDEQDVLVLMAYGNWLVKVFRVSGG